jgi:hypothetical protein
LSRDDAQILAIGILLAGSVVTVLAIGLLRSDFGDYKLGVRVAFWSLLALGGFVSVFGCWYTVAAFNPDFGR